MIKTEGGQAAARIVVKAKNGTENEKINQQNMN
jgi:hypothetical protein